MLDKNFLEEVVRKKENSVKKKNELYRNKYRDLKKPVKVKPQIKKFKLNQADSSSLQSIRGIGRVLSSRIVRYRNMLGGFINYDQLTEVYGLEQDVITRLQQNSFIDPGFIPEKLKVNELSDYHLSRHPYIERAAARIIVNYRGQHGPFKTSLDLNQIDIIDSVAINRLLPYLSFE